MQRFSGIIHQGGIPNGPHIHLPLEQLDARAFIVDICSRVSLIQRYFNPSDHPTSRAVYYFPVPARAAICSFELRTSGGKVLSGICKEKTQAREEHEQAVAKGEYTGLLEYVTDDIFTISIGSISAKETVYVKLMFIMNLMNDHDRDFLRFYLPVAVGQRYGAPPEALNGAAIPSAQTRLRVKIDVQTSGTIRSITSPTHTIKVEQYNTNLGRASRRRATVSFRSNTFLTEDFVLLLQADGLDAPRCFAQIYRDARKQNNDTLAVQLTIVPKFNMPPIRSQEYIFLVDRSGSMDGNRIETAKKTLTLLLRMLPKQGSYFNVFSFGSHADSLWTRSNVYDQHFLDVATQHVETMAANYGGTEILQGLERVFRQRNTSLPTAVFVLTDGESHDVDNVAALVRSAVQGSSASSPLRVYTLGIGSQVSSAMCENIASSGNGACLFATRVEDITAKCARLLRAGRTPFVKDVHVEWGVPASVLASSTTTGTGTSSYTPPNVQQAPTVIHDIHADVRLVIFAIFQLRKTFSPREVILRGKVDGTGEAFHLVVPIRGVQLSDFDPQLPPIHTLAASQLIREYEAGLVPIPRSTNGNVHEARKQAIVYLGTRYHLVSRHTSFVAIEKGPQNPSGQHLHQTGGLLSTLRSVLTSFTVPSTSPSPSTAPDEFVNANFPIPGGWPGSPRPSNRRSHRASGVEDAEDSDDTAETYSTMSSLEGSSSEHSYWTEDGLEELSEEDANLQRSPSPQFGHDPNIPHVAPIQDSHVPPAALLSPQVSDLLSLQRADGAFILNDSMKAIVGQRAVEEGASMGVKSDIWATVLCVAFLQKHLPSQNELRNDLLMKAYEFLHGEAGVDGLLQRAMQLVM